MRTDTDFAAAEARLGRTLRSMADTVPDEAPPFAPRVTVSLEHRRPVRRTVAVAAAVAAAVTVGVVVVTGDDATGPSIRLGGNRPAPAAPTPTPADGLVAVPNVVGLTLEQAYQRLEAAGFHAVPIGSRDTPNPVVGTQNVTGRAAPGTNVELTLVPG